MIQNKNIQTAQETKQNTNKYERAKLKHVKQKGFQIMNSTHKKQRQHAHTKNIKTKLSHVQQNKNNTTHRTSHKIER